DFRRFDAEVARLVGVIRRILDSPSPKPSPFAAATPVLASPTPLPIEPPATVIAAAHQRTIAAPATTEPAAAVPNQRRVLSIIGLGGGGTVVALMAFSIASWTPPKSGPSS